MEWIQIFAEMDGNGVDVLLGWIEMHLIMHFDILFTLATQLIFVQLM